jgi:hypothetical protein
MSGLREEQERREIMMRVFALCLLSVLSGAAFATGETGQTANYIDQSATIDRFRELERMDVTSERGPADPSEIEPVSAELEAILDDVEGVETEQ